MFEVKKGEKLANITFEIRHKVQKFPSRDPRLICYLKKAKDHEF